MRALTPEQRRQATARRELPGEVFTAAFRDNCELKYEGLRGDVLASDRSACCSRLLETYRRSDPAGTQEYGSTR